VLRLDEEVVPEVGRGDLGSVNNREGADRCSKKTKRSDEGVRDSIDSPTVNLAE